jgi:hypothetical protein
LRSTRKPRVSVAPSRARLQGSRTRVRRKRRLALAARLFPRKDQAPAPGRPAAKVTLFESKEAARAAKEALE